MSDIFNFITVIINFFLYFVLLFIIWWKNKRFSAIEILLLMYAMVSFCGIIYYQQGTEQWQFDIFYFLYLFFVFFIGVLPIKNTSKIEVNYSPIRYSVFYKIVSWVFIGLSIYSCIVYLPQVIFVLTNPDWAELYADSHDESLAFSGSVLANAFFHIRYLGIVLFFSFLPEKKSIFFKTILGIASFLPVTLVTLTKASRGGIVSLVVSLILSFMIFKPLYPHKTIKRVALIALILMPLAFIYFMAVSTSRFDTNSSTLEDSFLSYIGQPMLCFNYGVMDSITGYANGAYMFNIGDYGRLIKGCHFGSGFITYIGCLYLDYGFWGTIFIAALVAILVKAVINSRKRLGIPELFILVTYFMLLFNGVFILPPSYGQQWIEAAIIYLLLRLFENIFNPKVLAR